VATTKPQTVLVVEDEASIASFVAAYLKNAGYDVRTTASGNEALRIVGAEKPALVVLDLMLPDVDGVEVCKRIRQQGELPVLMLTARDEDVDKIIGLEVGADDYMTKPFNPRELVARVKAILRRADGSSKPAGDAAVIRVGALSIDKQRREAKVGDTEITLRTKEFDLLATLAENAGIVLTREQLLDRVWGYNFYGETRTVDVHVQHVRAKIADSGLTIVTVRGVGYKLVDRDER